MKELFEAVRSGDLARVTALIEADPSLAIFAASILGDVPRLEQLLAGNRSLISAISEDGWTPLHLAAFFGKPEAVRLLLNRGAQAAARSTNSMQNTPLHAAAAGRSSEVVKILIERGASPNARQNGGWTALHAAAQNGDLDTARALIDGGAHIETRADNNQTALDLALTAAHHPMTELLESASQKSGGASR